MQIKVKNLGALKQAEFSLGDLTIICGKNNTRKTYATYALFGFLHTWRQMLSISIHENKIRQLLAQGVVHFDIQEYLDQEYLDQDTEIINKGKPYFRAISFELSL